MGPAFAWLAALFATAAGAAPAHASTVWPQPAGYTAQLRYDARRQVLSGTDRIAFLNNSSGKLSSVWLRVWPNGYGSCAHPFARVSVARGGHVAARRAGCTALRVRLTHPVPAGSRGAFTLRVRVKAPHAPDRFGQDHGVVYFGNALPLLDVQAAAGPSLEPYSGVGDPFYSLVASWSIRLDVPRRLTVAATGETRSSHAIGHGLKRVFVEASFARDFAIVFGRFAVDSSVTSGGVRLRHFRPAGESRSASLETLRVARGAVETYSSWYGAPGEREIDIVPGPGSFDGFGAGMEYPGLVLTSEQPQVVAHELAHQWWYSLVGDDQWRSPWLDESFAEFSSRRLPASIVPRDGLQCDFADPVRPFGSAMLTDSMRHWDTAGAGAYYREVYLGGTCALRSLEHDLGSDAMTAFLRSYIDEHRWGLVTTADFVAALRAAAPPGYDVDAFLRRARIARP